MPALCDFKVLLTSFICMNKDEVWFLCCDFIQASEMYVIQRHFRKISSRPFQFLGHCVVKCVVSSQFFDQIGRATDVGAAKIGVSCRFNEIYRSM